MAFEQTGMTITLPASGTLTQFTAVGVNASGQADPAANPIGIVQDSYTVGQAATIMVTGLSKYKATGALAAGDVLTVNTVALGTVVKGAGAAGEVATVLMK